MLIIVILESLHGRAQPLFVSHHLAVGQAARARHLGQRGAHLARLRRHHAEGAPLERAVHVFRTSGTTTRARGALHLDTLALYEASLLPTFRRHLLPESILPVIASGAGEVEETFCLEKPPDMADSRAEIMSLVPATFGSVWLAMSLLVVVLVIIGMTMDPYGAVILVSATIASVAYRNGIDPVHFWMVVLVAFELGYLTPPVALNHLLTRQVVGVEEARLADQEGDTFWRRHERILLPVCVMATALVIVAFVPLLLAA